MCVCVVCGKDGLADGGGCRQCVVVERRSAVVAGVLVRLHDRNMGLVR